MKAYKLLRPMPGLPAGAVFLHDDKNYSGLGNSLYGSLVLAWENGGCQGDWCGETFFLPGQLTRDPYWFLPTPNPILPGGRRRFHASLIKASAGSRQVIKTVRDTLNEIEKELRGGLDER